MKGKMMNGRAKRNTGGVNQAKEDLDRKNLRYTYQSNVNEAAEERKRGGKTMKKHVGKSGGRQSHPSCWPQASQERWSRFFGSEPVHLGSQGHAASGPQARHGDGISISG
jgi:hypothetical protein